MAMVICIRPKREINEDEWRKSTPAAYRLGGKAMVNKKKSDKLNGADRLKCNGCPFPAPADALHAAATSKGSASKAAPTFNKEKREKEEKDANFKKRKTKCV